jgi:hypothetical protein
VNVPYPKPSDEKLLEETEIAVRAAMVLVLEHKGGQDAGGYLLPDPTLVELLPKLTPADQFILRHRIVHWANDYFTPLGHEQLILSGMLFSRIIALNNEEPAKEQTAQLVKTLSDRYPDDPEMRQLRDLFLLTDEEVAQRLSKGKAS